MTLISRLPVIPLYYNGNTKFRPIHVTDLVNIIFSILESNNQNLTLECIGPETLSFKDILKNLLVSIKKKEFVTFTFTNCILNCKNATNFTQPFID